MRFYLFIFSVVFAVISTAAGVSPDDAGKNISHWLKLLGIENIPELLNSPIVNDLIYYGGLCFSLILLILLLISIRKKNNAINPNKKSVKFQSTFEQDFDEYAKHKDAGTTPKLRPDSYMSEAIDYLINILFPDRDPHSLDYQVEFPTTTNEITAKLRTGELKAWGLYTGESVEREFDKDAWEYRELLPLEASISTEKNKQTKSVIASTEQHQLTGLRVNMNQVKSIWKNPANEFIATEYEFIPLREAANILYEELRHYDKNHAQIIMSETDRESNPEGVLTYFAITIGLHGDVLGTRPPSTKLEIIDKNEFNKGYFRNNASEFIRYGKDNPEFTQLAVESKTLPKTLDWLKENNITK